MDIRAKYHLEISQFEAYVKDLADGKVKEINDIPGNAYASNLAGNILESFNEVIDAIQEEKPGAQAEIDAL